MQFNLQCLANCGRLFGFYTRNHPVEVGYLTEQTRLIAPLSAQILEMSEAVFISEQHPVSYRWAVVEDDGLSVWLYLTAPDSEDIVADCWVYNRIASSEHAASYIARGVAPPASSEVIGTDAFIQTINSLDFCLEWSRDGESVALLFNKSPVGLIVSGYKRGYSRNLNQVCAWGSPLNETLYHSVFGIP